VKIAILPFPLAPILLRYLSSFLPRFQIFFCHARTWITEFHRWPRSFHSGVANNVPLRKVSLSGIARNTSHSAPTPPFFSKAFSRSQHRCRYSITTGCAIAQLHSPRCRHAYLGRGLLLSLSLTPLPLFLPLSFFRSLSRVCDSAHVRGEINGPILAPGRSYVQSGDSLSSFGLSSR